MESKKVEEMTLDELMDKRDKLKMAIKRVNSEIEKKRPTKKKGNDKPTKDDIKMMLTRHNKQFKTGMTKNELMEIVKKNNLVRVVEEYAKNKK
jgi:hypothetical protein